MAEAMTKRRPVTEIRPVSPCPLQADAWPLTIPAVASLLREGLKLAQATILTGDNGSGKSTLVEAIAMAYGLNPEGGSTGANHRTRPSESSLHDAITLVRSPGPHRGYFLRAETMHGLYTYLEHNRPPQSTDPQFHDMSHGESFNAVLDARFTGEGLFVLDEPESALSFTGCLALLVRLAELLTNPRAQVIVATHSPIVAALPGARTYELDATGIHEQHWSDLNIVEQQRAFLHAPDAFVRHLTQ